MLYTGRRGAQVIKYANNMQRLREEQQATFADRIKQLEEKKVEMMVKKRALKTKLEQVRLRREARTAATRE